MGKKRPLDRRSQMEDAIYTIGYIPEIAPGTGTSDGAFRRIKSERGGGYQTSYRRGYYAYDSLLSRRENTVRPVASRGYRCEILIARL